MPQNVKVGNENFAFPIQGESPPNGAPITAWAVAVSGTLATLSGPSDIQLSEGVVNNNQVSPVPITATKGRNLQFSDATLVGATITYAVERLVAGNTVRQFGEYSITKSTNVWDGVDEFVGEDTGVRFDVTASAGVVRITYTSTNLTPGTGKVYYFARAISSV